MLALTLSFLDSAPTGSTGASALDVMVVSLSSLTIFLIPLIALLLSMTRWWAKPSVARFFSFSAIRSRVGR